MYRKDPKALKSILTSMDQNPDSQILGAWYERLHFKEKVNKEKHLCFKKVSYSWAF